MMVFGWNTMDGQYFTVEACQMAYHGSGHYLYTNYKTPRMDALALSLGMAFT